MAAVRARASVAWAGSAAAVPPGRLPGEVTVEHRADGLTVCVLANPQAPVVTTALWYRAGTRDEPPGHGGIAHFLEHMMFKGSARYGPGEIDRLTQALGGDNNAFTSHDATAYYFNFAPDRWREALAIEADRMTALTLDPTEVESERRVILEEIAMYQAEPWDALEARVLAARYPSHAYGRPVLGTRDELLATGPAELADFHRFHYRPPRAVLVVAGDIAPEAALAAVEEAFGGDAGPVDDEAPPPQVPDAPELAGLQRVEQRKGEVARLMVALPAPAAGAPDDAALRVASDLLGSGRSSRLTRRLVDEEQLCVWTSADLSETVEAGTFTVTAELVPGVAPERVEEIVLGELADLAAGRRPATAVELERARRIAVADWVFSHDRIHQQALAAGFALALFDLDYPEREMARVLAVDGDELAGAAVRWLDPEAGAVVGWSLPTEGESEPGDGETDPGGWAGAEAVVGEPGTGG